jgi:hypothetical protein
VVEVFNATLCTENSKFKKMNTFLFEKNRAVVVVTIFLPKYATNIASNIRYILLCSGLGSKKKNYVACIIQASS